MEKSSFTSKIFYIKTTNKTLAHFFIIEKANYIVKCTGQKLQNERRTA